MSVRKTLRSKRALNRAFRRLVIHGLGHFHLEIQHGCLVIFIQKFNMGAWSFSFRNSTWLLGHFHSEIHHGCLVIFIQKFIMAAWSFSFRNSCLLGHFHSESHHGCLVIFIQKFKMAAWSFMHSELWKKSSIYIYCSLPGWFSPLPSGWCVYTRCSSVRQD